MARHDDTLAEIATRPIAAPPALESTERLRKVPGRVGEHGFRVIQDAISLKRALTSHWIIPMDDGVILSIIAEEWMKAESARLSGKGSSGG